MTQPIEISIASDVAADRAEVWRSISSMAGVNYELRPVLRMSSPREQQALPVEVVPGGVIFRSWLLLFGLLPLDRHALALERVDGGIGFVEESTSWLQRRWRHERTLSIVDDRGCNISDRLVVEPRLAPLRPVIGVVVKQLFEHRHRRLVRRFGAGTGT